MTRSRMKITRHELLNAAVRPRSHPARNYLPLSSAIAAILAGVPVAQAQQQVSGLAGAVLEEVVVTAQKVTENAQTVPVDIQVLGAEKLEQLNVLNLDDYVKYMPSVSYVRNIGQGGNGQPGTSHVYMRGVVSGGDGNHSGPQPSVGTYLDETPVTTIDGALDVHIYDIERIEVLEGPQGTLYGASSEAGTIRIITNKPDPSKFAAGYDLDINSVDHGGVGYEAEGFVNLPLSPVAAIRLVGWDEHDAGFISNVAGTNNSACIVNGVRTFPTWDGQPSAYPAITPCPSVGVIGAGAISNAAFVKSDYNTVETKGGRGALRLNLGDNWTVTPTVMGQAVGTEGFFGYDPAVGDLELAHFGPEGSQDSWVQSAMTIEGKMSDFDLVYAGAYMKRTTHETADYSDYSEFYDRAYGSGAYWLGNNGKPIDGQEIFYSHNYFQKWSHELRISTPQQLAVKATAGVFIERQLHDIFEQYAMPGYDGDGLATSLSIPTLPTPSIWLTDEQRVDRDQALFGQVTWDITSKWSASAGLRYFKSDNTLQGFFGYSYNYYLATGYSAFPVGQPGIPAGAYLCQAPYQSLGTLRPPSTLGAPCTDLDSRVSDAGTVPRYNLSYKIDADRLVYATFSKGFRPGGVNRTTEKGIGPYGPDFLTNYEVGWKTQWFGNRLRWNGALFWEDWNNFQFSFLGPNGVTVIENGGNARIKGLESELEWLATGNLLLSVNFTFLDPRLTQNYCGENDPDGAPATSNPCPANPGAGRPAPYTALAPAGTNLPVTPKFKGNLVARYTFDDEDGWQPFIQGAFVYQTQTAPLLQVDNTQVVGMQPAYGLFDLSGGVVKSGMTIQLLVSNVFDRRAELSRFVQCTVNNTSGEPVCAQPYVIPAPPRTVVLKFGHKF